jgi:uncharacterized membrane protein YiaA
MKDGLIRAELLYFNNKSYFFTVMVFIVLKKKKSQDNKKKIYVNPMEMKNTNCNYTCIGEKSFLLISSNNFFILSPLFECMEKGR